MVDLLPFIVYKFNIYIYIYMKVPTTHLPWVGIQNHFAFISQKLFFPNMFCFSYLYRGRNLFLNFVLHRGVVALHRGSCLRSTLAFFLQSGLKVNHSYEKTLIENAEENFHSKAMYASSNQNVNHSQAQMCLHSEGSRGRARNSNYYCGGGRFI